MCIYIEIYFDFLINYVNYYGCNNILLKLIINSKKKLSDYKIPVVEISKKYQNINNYTYISYRYTTPVLFSEFIRYDIIDQHLILKELKFTPKDLIKFIEMLPTKINENTDIIFGIGEEGKDIIGKIYFDQEKYLMCFESNTKIKYYNKISNNKIKVIDLKTGKLHGYHVRNKNIFSNIYWTNKCKNVYTEYFRPYHIIP